MNRTKQNCGNCSSFRNLNNNPVGSCCFNPPVVMTSMQQSVAHAGPVPVLQGVFPPTNINAWCHKWESILDFDLDAMKEN